MSQGGTTQKQQVTLEPCSPRSCNSIGAAITIAMVSVALGYACCENLIYIFIYSEGSIGSGESLYGSHYNDAGLLLPTDLFLFMALFLTLLTFALFKEIGVLIGRSLFPVHPLCAGKFKGIHLITTEEVHFSVFHNALP